MDQILMKIMLCQNLSPVKISTKFQIDTIDTVAFIMFIINLCTAGSDGRRTTVITIYYPGIQ